MEKDKKKWLEDLATEAETQPIKEIHYPDKRMAELFNEMLNRPELPEMAKIERS